MLAPPDAVHVEELIERLLVNFNPMLVKAVVHVPWKKGAIEVRVLLNAEVFACNKTREHMS
jgi:hypothetical protein